jgi:hypothetical protein
MSDESTAAPSQSADSIMALADEYAMESPCDDPTCPVCKSRAALRAAVEQLCRERDEAVRERGKLRQRAAQAEKAAKTTIEDCKRQGVSIGRSLANYGYGMAERDKAEALALLKEARPCVEYTLGAVEMDEHDDTVMRDLLARIDAVLK